MTSAVFDVALALSNYARMNDLLLCTFLNQPENLYFAVVTFPLTIWWLFDGRCDFPTHNLVGQSYLMVDVTSPLTIWWNNLIDSVVPCQPRSQASPVFLFFSFRSV